MEVARVGCPMMILQQKLENMKLALKVWNIQVFGNNHLNFSRALEQLHLIQKRIQLERLEEDLKDLEAKAQDDLHEAIL